MSLIGIIASSKAVSKNYWDTIVDDGAYSAFKYDETTGSTVADFINALGMTGYGTYTLNQTGPGITDVTKAISYNGSTGYHQTTSGDKSNYNVAPNGSWAVECWLKTTTASLSQAITVRGGDILCGLYLSAYSAGKITATSNDFGGGELSITGTTTVNDGNWHHIVGTAQSGGSFYLYIDGVEDAITATARKSTTANRSIGVGANIAVPTQFLNGTVAAPAFYTSYLTSTQVLSHYTKGIA